MLLASDVQGREGKEGEGVLEGCGAGFGEGERRPYVLLPVREPTSVSVQFTDDAMRSDQGERLARFSRTVERVFGVLVCPIRIASGAVIPRPEGVTLRLAEDG